MRTTPTLARRAAVPLLGAAALATSGLLAAMPANAAGHGVTWTRSCAVDLTPGHAFCNALHVTSTVERVNAKGVTPSATPSGFGPSDLLSAYNIPANGGAGQTVAIVDAYDDPNAESDLATYRTQFGLPACTTANGCFKKVSQTGTTKYPRSSTSWAGEISLDLDMVSAMAPNAHIILVEASTASMTNLGTAVNTAASLGATEISNSYGGSESSADTGYDSTYFNHPGIAITVSSGDSGYGVEYPAASPNVTAVGGTALKRDSTTARGWSESVWSTSSTEGAGSGCSAYEPKPTWQADSGCAKRTVADVSAVADPATGVAVYQTYGGSGWTVYGGTSVAAPLIAGVYADAGSHSAIPAAKAYANQAALNDVTVGATTSCTPAYLCAAETGYDGPTGLGTPNGLTAFTG